MSRYHAPPTFLFLILNFSAFFRAEKNFEIIFGLSKTLPNADSISRRRPDWRWKKGAGAFSREPKNDLGQLERYNSDQVSSSSDELVKTFLTCNLRFFSLVCAYWACFALGSTARHHFLFRYAPLLLNERNSKRKQKAQQPAGFEPTTSGSWCTCSTAVLQLLSLLSINK